MGDFLAWKPRPSILGMPSLKNWILQLGCGLSRQKGCHDPLGGAAASPPPRPERLSQFDICSIVLYKFETEITDKGGIILNGVKFAYIL